MASKSKRSSTRTTRESAIDTSSQPDDSSINASNYSPNSSTSHRWSRQQEKQQLSNLNDRLATYIERVRNLESENARLHVQVREVEVVERKERDDLSSRYENKIKDTRDQLDRITRENAKLEIEKSKALDGFNELKSRVADLEKKLKRSEADSRNAFNQVQDLTARLNNADNGRTIAEKENNALKKELEGLQKQLDVLLKQLEDEVVLRTELEHKLATCKEDLDFARRNHNTQMEDFRRKRQVEMTSFSNEVENRYQTKLQEQLQQMRDSFDQRIAQNRAELDDLFKSKLAEADSIANRNRAAASEAREEASRSRLRIHDLETSLSGYEAQLNSVNNRVKDLEAQLRRQQDEADIRIQQREERINALEREAAAMLNDYQDLMDVKVQLDTELQAYQKLLEGEETRLHITPTTSPNVSQHHVSFEDPISAIQNTLRRGIKRKRLDEDSFDFKQTSKTFKSNSHSDGPVIIEEIDPEGQFIRLTNKGEEDIAVGGWFVKSVAGEKEVTFKFHSRQSIKAGKSITLWSNNSGQEHAPPFNIVMKNQTWPTGDAVRTELSNDQEVLVAWHECILQHGFYRAENGSDPDQRCSIM